MTSNRDLMHAHVEALFTHDAEGQLLRVNESNGAPAPRFFLGRTTDGLVVRFRHDVDHATRRELEAAVDADVLGACGSDSAFSPTRYEDILARSARVERTETGPAFAFPPDLRAPGETIVVSDANVDILRRYLEPWVPDVQLSAPLVALTVDGHAVSVCGSVRRTDMAHEAGVETAAQFRGRGYAAQVVTGWANAVREMNRVPLYSTSWRNEASRTVARKLALIHFGSDLHIT
jgi:GNAT acetyltransferase